MLQLLLTDVFLSINESSYRWHQQNYVVSVGESFGKYLQLHPAFLTGPCAGKPPCVWA